jgi:rhamnosyltransferase
MIAIGFVVYLPPKELLARVELATKLGHRVYLYDNSPERERLHKVLEPLPNVCYFSEGRNNGLGPGLATICENAWRDSFETLLFFDQDTVFDCSTLDFVEEVVRSAGAGYVTSHSAIVFAAGAVREIRDVLLAISSGSLFFLQNLKSLGWHNRSYFVDGVDYEFCLRTAIHGFKIGRCSGTPGFDHIAGQPDTLVTVGARQLQLRRYAPNRIADTTKAYTRIISSSLSNGQFRFALAMIRSYAIYAAGQILARILLK